MEGFHVREHIFQNKLAVLRFLATFHIFKDFSIHNMVFQGKSTFSDITNRNKKVCSKTCREGASYMYMHNGDLGVYILALRSHHIYGYI
jgi:hypothetical protein